MPLSHSAYAKHMRDALPGASFIGFTGTPIEKADAHTQETFGGYVSIYDIEQMKSVLANFQRLRLHVQQLHAERDTDRSTASSTRFRRTSIGWA